jgi:hypothetical protein
MLDERFLWIFRLLLSLVYFHVRRRCTVGAHITYLLVFICGSTLRIRTYYSSQVYSRVARTVDLLLDLEKGFEQYVHI